MMCINAKWKHTQTIIAGVGDVPVQMAGGVRIDWHDLSLSSLSGKYVQDVCDDPDVLCWSFISSVNANVAMLPQRSCHHY